MSASEARALVAKISEPLREVLILGGQGYTSKEIGRELGIAPVTVDQRFARARVKLGGRDRRDTARLFLTLLAAAGYEPTMYGPLSVADHEATTAPPPSSQQPERMVADSEGEDSIAQQMLFQAPPPPTPQHGLFPFPTNGGRRNGLTLGQRLFWIAVVALLSMLALRSIIEALKDLGDF